MAGNKLEAGKSENLTNRGRGRPAGSVNKATKTFRDTINTLLEGNAENVSVWLDQVATGGGDPDKADPAKALDLLAKLAEFAAPKLSRAEVANADDKAFETVNRVQFEIVHAQT